MNGALRNVCLALAGAALAGCVSLAPVEGRVLPTVYDQRFTDEAVRRDWEAMEGLRQSVAEVRTSRPASYGVWRAELMLDFGVHEYEENDRTTIADALLNDSARTVDGVRRGKVDASSPRLPAVKRVRDDLWSQVSRVKLDPRVLDCAGEAIARLEVALVELGHNAWEVDAGMNTPEHLEPCPLEPLVDDLAADLEATRRACIDADQPEPVDLPVTRLALAAGALFQFDRCAAGDMLPEGRAQLDAFGGSLAADPAAWRKLVIVGHTDRLGRRDYNMRLSLCRAEAVRDYLVQGFALPPERVGVRGMGPLEPVAFCTGEVNDELKACLQPNRRVEIEVHR